MKSNEDAYADLSVVDKPEPTATLWRYMNMMKFLWMMETESLYARNTAKLEDEYEGSLPQSKFRRIVDIVKMKLPLEYVGNPYVEGCILLRSRDLRNTAFVNCWNESEDESLLMWREYADISRGIAIKTDFCSLQTSLAQDEQLTFGKIKYMDYDEVSYENVNRYNQLFLKQTLYSWEHEVRVMGLGNFQYYFQQNISQHMEVPESLYFNVELADLIHDIVMAPYADREFIQIIEAVATQHGMADRVTESSLRLK